VTEAFPAEAFRAEAFRAEVRDWLAGHRARVLRELG
jgi:hypothetical protein